MLKKIFLVVIILVCPIFSVEKDQSVVCLHGFMGSPWNMSFLKKNLKKDGWDVVNWGYPSRDKYIRQHADELVLELVNLSRKRPGKPIHFVTHSMGSLVLLSALNHPDCPYEAKIGKIALIAPPLKGASWGRWLGKFSFARLIAKGFSGKELMEKPNFDELGNYPQSLDEILVIAGNLGVNPFIKGRNDGMVAVEETDLPVPHKRVVLLRGHKTIIFSKKVCSLVCEFLRQDTNN